MLCWYINHVSIVYVKFNVCKLSIHEKHVYASKLAPVETLRNMTQGVDQTTKLTAVTTQATTIAIQPSPQSTTATDHERVSSIATGMTAAETSTVLQTPTMTPNFTTIGLYV